MVALVPTPLPVHTLGKTFASTHKSLAVTGPEWGNTLLSKASTESEVGLNLQSYHESQISPLASARCYLVEIRKHRQTERGWSNAMVTSTGRFKMTLLEDSQGSGEGRICDTRFYRDSLLPRSVRLVCYLQQFPVST